MDMTNKNNDTVISGTADADYLVNRGSNVVINGEAGNDRLHNNQGSNVTLNAGTGDDQIVLNNGTDIVVNGDAGNDFFNLFEGSEYITINSGDGRDRFTVRSAHTYIDGGTGDDYFEIWNHTGYVTLMAGDGDDIIKNNGGENSIIYGDDGNDSIDNTIYTKNSTVVGGTGDDTIKWYWYDWDKDNAHAIQYAEGDGNDVVVITSNNIEKCNLAIVKGEYTFTNDGEDLLVKVGDGSIRFLGMAGKSININGTPIIAETSTPSTTTQNLIPISATTSTTTNSGGGTTIINGPVYINNTTINNTTINETNINYITSVNNTYIYNGGDKVINNYVEGQAVQLTSDYQGIDFNGNSFYVNSSSGQLEIQNSRDKFIGYSGHDNNVVAYSYWASGGGQIDGRGKNQTEILIGGDNANNQIYAGSGGSSMWGGNGGTDTLTGGDGYDEFFYAVGSGNDVVQNAGDNDVINLLGVSLSQITYAEVKSSEINIGFTDGGRLQLQGQSATGFKLENVTYTANRSTGGWDTK